MSFALEAELIAAGSVITLLRTVLASRHACSENDVPEAAHWPSVMDKPSHFQGTSATGPGEQEQRHTGEHHQPQ
jgi:hypothetical protein